MDIKRVAFETKPVQIRDSGFGIQGSGFGIPKTIGSRELEDGAKNSPTKRAEIAALVDKFLSQKLAETPIERTSIKAEKEIQNPKSKIQNPQTDSPVKTIIHQLKPQETNGGNGTKSKAVDFVSENDVKKASADGVKIFVTAKTIITPSARDLGEEKDIFAKV